MSLHYTANANHAIQSSSHANHMQCVRRTWYWSRSCSACARVQPMASCKDGRMGGEGMCGVGGTMGMAEEGDSQII